MLEEIYTDMYVHKKGQIEEQKVNCAERKKKI
jgi:hypothetical protein